MLNDPTFVKEMTAEFDQYLQENNNGQTNPSIVWDAAKAVLRGKIIARQTMLKKKKTQDLVQLQDKLKALEESQFRNKNTDRLNRI